MLRRALADGQRMPRGYGLAYYDINYLMAVCYPWPLNHIVASWRHFWFAVRDARPSVWDVRLLDAYQKGRYEAWSDGYKCGSEAGRREGRLDGAAEGIVAALFAERKE